MLDKVDLTADISKEEYKKAMEAMELELGSLQREARSLGFPVIIVFEGWEASGKGTLINELILPLDPRGFNVYTLTKSTQEEKMRPYLWRFWQKIPARGRLAVFDRCWYDGLLRLLVKKKPDPLKYKARAEEILAFERQLSADGCLVVKFFLHISKEEQKKRFENLLANPHTQWRVSKQDLKQNVNYYQFLDAYEKIIQTSNTPHSPWTVVGAHKKRCAEVAILQTVIHRLKTQIAAAGTLAAAVVVPSSGNRNYTVLSKIDLSQKMDKESSRQELKKYQAKLRELEYALYKKRVPAVILYEGWDAAGKGGNIKRLVANLDPRGYEVIPIGAPDATEKAHHYLWRFWQQFPKAGHLAIFDRTWYGRVMVERIEGFCRPDEWERAYQEIREMEEQWIRFGTVLVKFWLHIDKETQLKRFKARELDLNKTWKITPEDWRNREKWDEYAQAVNEMLERTSTPAAPWTVIESDNKYFARVKTLKTVVAKLEQVLLD